MAAVIDLSALGTRGFVIQGDQSADLAGSDVALAGDVNKDGFDDIIVSAPFGDSGGEDAGEVYVVFGKAGGFGTVDLSSLTAAQGFAINGDGLNDYAGQSVAGAGDLNGDGFADIVIGAAKNDDGGDGAGAAYVIFGKASGFATVDLGALAAGEGFTITGDEIQDRAGHSVSSAGDVNGDGIDDLIVGAPGSDDGGASAGQAYVIYGKSAGLGNVDLGALTPADGFALIGDADGDDAGWSVASAGDVNGDGVGDIIMSAYYGNDGGGKSGESYVIFGKPGGHDTIDLSALSSGDGFKIVGSGYSYTGPTPYTKVYFGADRVSGGSDINGDGFDDLLVGSPRSTEYGDGTVSVIFGKAGGFGTIHLGQLSYNQGIHVYGGQDGGFDMSAAGDVNGDGFDDFIVGAPGADDGGIDAGNAYVIYGREDPDWVSLRSLGPTEGFLIQGDQGGDMAGRSVSGGGDVNGDGFADIVVGAPYGDDGGASAGEAYVIFGAAPTTGVTRIGSAIGQTIRGGIGDDRLDGRDGDDLLLAAGGDDELLGAAGNDDLNGGEGDDALSGGSGHDKLTGGAGIDSLTGGSGNDMLEGGSGGDSMNGGSGNDVYRVDSMADQIVETDGGGSDRLFARVSYTLAEGVYVEALNTLSNSGTTVINLIGNSFANKIIGNAGINTLSGGGGADSLNGLAGNDRIYGGAG
ncbi:MAG TPA: hypothetical protein VF589_13060, partial [Allosphingosinicella sp.]